MAEGSSTSVQYFPDQEFSGRKEYIDWFLEKFSEMRRGRRHMRDPNQVHRYKIYGLYGTKGVGKSQLMKEIIRILEEKNDSNGDIHVLYFDFSELKSFESFLDSLCDSFGVPRHKWKKATEVYDEDEPEDFYHCMCDIEKKLSGNSKYFLFFDNREFSCAKAKKDGSEPDKFKKALWDKIYEVLLKRFLGKCDNLFVFITATQTAKFANVDIRNSYCYKNLEEMSEEEATSLLKTLIGEMDVDKNDMASIVLLCDGLPSSIIRVGSLLTDQDRSYIPQEVICILTKEKLKALSDEFFPADDRTDEKLHEFLQQLSTESMRNLRGLAGLIPQEGSVHIDKVADHFVPPGYVCSSETEKRALFKLHILNSFKFRGMVDVSQDTEIRMNRLLHEFALRNIPIGDEFGELKESDLPTAGPWKWHPIEGRIGGHHSPEDDRDSSKEDEDNSHDKMADHLIVPSQQSQSKLSRILPEDDLSFDPKSLPVNTARQKGQNFDDQEGKLQYDFVLSNQNQNSIRGGQENSDDSQPGKETDMCDSPETLDSKQEILSVKHSGQLVKEDNTSGADFATERNKVLLPSPSVHTGTNGKMQCKNAFADENRTDFTNFTDIDDHSVCRFQNHSVERLEQQPERLSSLEENRRDVNKCLRMKNVNLNSLKENDAPSSSFVQEQHLGNPINSEESKVDTSKLNTLYSTPESSVRGCQTEMSCRGIAKNIPNETTEQCNDLGQRPRAISIEENISIPLRYETKKWQYASSETISCEDNDMVLSNSFDLAEEQYFDKVLNRGESLAETDGALSYHTVDMGIKGNVPKNKDRTTPQGDFLQP